MPDSLLTSLYSLLDSQTVGRVANSLGISQQSTLQGLKSAIAAVLAGLLGKSEEPGGALTSVLDLCPKLSGEGSLTQSAREAFSSNSSLLFTGRQISSALFGASATTVTDAVGAVSGLCTGDAATVLSIAALVVTGFIANRILAHGMNIHDVRRKLQSESDGIRNALPGSLQVLLEPARVTPSSPAVARDGEQKRQPVSWLPLLALLVLISALMWVFGHTRNAGHGGVPGPKEPQTIGLANRTDSTEPSKTGTANRVDTDPVEFVKRLLVDKIDLRFDRGSAKVRPESRGQLDMIASTIATYPDVHLTLTGHTDNTGGVDANRRLSRKRANAVIAELIQKGVPTDHLSSESQAEPGTIADNSTEEGLAKNRCVTLDVSQH